MERPQGDINRAALAKPLVGLVAFQAISEPAARVGADDAASRLKNSAAHRRYPMPSAMRSWMAPASPTILRI